MSLAQRARAQAPFLVVLGLLVVSVLYLSVAPGRWRRGSLLIAIAMLLAGLLRAVLAPQAAGLLAVRQRWLDTCCYLGLGTLILAIAIVLG
jgi:hypothetical protein